MSNTVEVLTLTEDKDGVCRFGLDGIERPLTEFAPPAAPFFVSAAQAAHGFVLIRIPPGWKGVPHPSPHRQMMFCLGGALKVTAGDGGVRVVRTGDAWLMADNDGPGHASEVVSEEPFDAVIVFLGEGA